ncbi:MAG: DUF2089 domain-containing protein [Chloroflexi bacterium]|jgi:hypothetical protein|nr:DUF2089 domain-containing protein [Chloroflexota bacterium]
MRKVLEHCPNCGGELEITRLNCKSCETVILARYEPCPFCKLSPESTRFVQAFVKTRGNLKEMERDLGQSYWTLRAKLNEVIQELGFQVEPVHEEEELAALRRQILDQLERGEIDPAEAAEQLNQLKRQAR